MPCHPRELTHLANAPRSVQAEYLPVIKAKQRTAFPPNFIHSLDSAHMMLTAIACDKSGTRPRGVTPASSVCS